METETMKSFVDEVITLNNPLLYAVCMTFLGKLVTWEKCPLANKHVLWILPLLGIPLYCFTEGWNGRHIMEGLVIGLAAIGVNQGYRKFIGGEPADDSNTKEKLNESNSITTVTKP